jgi:hypothetical protein
MSPSAPIGQVAGIHSISRNPQEFEQYSVQQEVETTAKQNK